MNLNNCDFIVDQIFFIVTIVVIHTLILDVLISSKSPSPAFRWKMMQI